MITPRQRPEYRVRTQYELRIRDYLSNRAPLDWSMAWYSFKLETCRNEERPLKAQLDYLVSCYEAARARGDVDAVMEWHAKLRPIRDAYDRLHGHRLHAYSELKLAAHGREMLDRLLAEARAGLAGEDLEVEIEAVNEPQIELFG